MGILDKLPWRKKEDDFDFSKDLGGDLGDAGGFGQSGMGQNSQFGNQDPLGPSFAPDPSMESPQMGQQPSQQRSYNYPGSAPVPGQNRQAYQEYDEAPSRDVELILAKLDAIKAELDSVHQRVRKLEQIADGSQSSPQSRAPSPKYNW